MPTSKKYISMYVTFEFICQEEKRKKNDVPYSWTIYWFNSTSHKWDVLYKKKRRLCFEEKFWVNYPDNLKEINTHLKYLDF